MANRPFLKTPKLPNEPNSKMPFPAKTLAISRFHPFSKQVKKGRFRAIFMLFMDHLAVKSGHSAPLRPCQTLVAAICGRHGGTKDKN
jgi:hypothetical protein